MVDNFDETKVNKIIDSFKSIGISEKEKSIGIIEDEVNIVKLAFLLKEQDKTPAIIFQKNTNATLRIVRRFAKDVEKLENEKYPRLINERIKNLKKAEKQYKQMENTMEKLTKSLENAKKKNESFRKDTRDFIRIAKHKEKEGIDDTDENVDVEALQKPTDDFIFTKYQNFSSGTVEEWVK
jgi:translation initiation factor 2B subunit (eIF-2B alpha/beta/delta family)